MLSGFLTVHSYLGSDTWSIYFLIGGCWRYSRYPLMYHPHARTAMQEKVGYKRPRRDQK